MELSSYTGAGRVCTPMMSERLNFHPVALATLDDFHGLVQDDHVRRFLMDGEMFPREWSEERVRDSDSLFEQRGVGLWLAYERRTEALVGFCGFLQIPSIHPEPQLVYALFERFTGTGYATEMARAAIAQARRQPEFGPIVASVDEANAASYASSRNLRSSELPRNLAALEASSCLC